MKSSGFTLIEVLVASAIAALLGYAVMLVLYQINRVQPAINRYTEPYISALIVQQQLLRDCCGIEVPHTQWLAIAQKQKEQEKSKEKKAAPAPDKSEDKKEENPPEQPKEEKKGELKIPLIKDLFLGTTAGDGMLDTISFITTNPMQPYWGDKTGKYVPRAVRVVYRLKEDKQVKRKTKRYVLLRQESESFELEKIALPEVKNWHQYTVAGHIKSLKVEYVSAVRTKKAAEEKAPAPPTAAGKPQQEKEAAPEPPETYDIKRSKEWKDRPIEPVDDKKKTQKDEPLIPQLIIFELVMYDEASSRSIPFSFTMPVYSDKVYIERLAGGNKLTDIIKKLADNVLPTDAKQMTPTPGPGSMPVAQQASPVPAPEVSNAVASSPGNIHLAQKDTHAAQS